MGDARSIPDAVHTKGRELARRIKDDPDFRQQVEADPYAALREAGLPEEAHKDFMRETGYRGGRDWLQGVHVVAQGIPACSRTGRPIRPRYLRQFLLGHRLVTAVPPTKRRAPSHE